MDKKGIIVLDEGTKETDGPDGICCWVFLIPYRS